MVNSKKKKTVEKKSKPSAKPSLTEGGAALAAVGHGGPQALDPLSLPENYRRVFEAFQRNLLSLLSHELRTPLMGVMNAIEMMKREQASGTGMGSAGQAGSGARAWMESAERNALRLNESLGVLLDLAAIEGGQIWHARLRETDLMNIVRAKATVWQGFNKEYLMKWDLGNAPPIQGSSVLADPQKLGRAIDLILKMIGKWAPAGEIGVSLSPNEFSFTWLASEESLKRAVREWGEAQAAVAGGIASPLSAFGGGMQSDAEFLARDDEEGLGSTAHLVILIELIRLHGGVFSLLEEKAGEKGTKLRWSVSLPMLEGEAALGRVLSIRAFSSVQEITPVGLILLQGKARKLGERELRELRSALFRSSDGVYPIHSGEHAGLISVVVEDCRPMDLVKIAERLRAQLVRAGIDVSFGVAHCPSDTLDPSLLVGCALKQLPLSVGESGVEPKEGESD